VLAASFAYVNIGYRQMESRIQFYSSCAAGNLDLRGVTYDVRRSIVNEKSLFGRRRRRRHHFQERATF
jgi:hypothetical protein